MSEHITAPVEDPDFNKVRRRAIAGVGVGSILSGLAFVIEGARTNNSTLVVMGAIVLGEGLALTGTAALSQPLAEAAPVEISPPEL